MILIYYCDDEWDEKAYDLYSFAISLKNKTLECFYKNRKEKIRENKSLIKYLKYIKKII